MNIIRSLVPAAALVVVTALVPMPAAAQGRGRGQDDRGGRAVERGRQEYRGRAYSRDYRAPAVRGYAPRQEYRYEPRRDYRYGPRVDARYRYVAPRYDNRYYGYRGYAPAYRGRIFERPYYAFRPRTHIGFGLWLGFGVPYPSAYIRTYPPPVWGYYGGRFAVIPGARSYGGLCFDIAPAYAPVYVDGAYVGVASDFGPYAQPLTLVPGPHRVMVRVGGYRPVNWNVTVVAGQVIPFHGTLAAY